MRFTRADEKTARHLLADQWALHPHELERREGARDDTFRARTDDGEYALKLSHPGDDPHVIGMQSAAMLHAAAAGLPVPLVVPTVDGGTHPVHAGRVAVLLTWLPGDVLYDLANGPAADEVGRTLGALSAALAGFEHPAAHRTSAWDLAAIAELEELLPLITRRDAVAAAIRGVPELAGLPHQVIHGDFHPANLIVDGDRVVGIVDFGDVLHTARVAELAIALSYWPPEEWDAVTAGFQTVVPLGADELEALVPCIRGRLAQRILLGAHTADGREDAERAVDALIDQLEGMP